MNHIYRLFWCAAKGLWVAVSEVAGKQGKSGASGRRPRRGARCVRRRHSLPTLALLLAPGVALALPTGGQVAAGAATLQQTPQTLTVNQSTPKVILNWQGFSIGSGETVNFNQPSASSVALNRVLGANPSDIYGHLNANGQVFLVNPNGVYFAPGARINVGGIAASTLGLTNQDFLAGRYKFSGSSTSGVVNQGRISAAPGGYVALIGPSASNQGTIQTPHGTTALGAGSSVNMTLAGDSLLSFRVSGSALKAQATNGGAIQADGGRVILSANAKNALLETVVNNTGLVRAQTVADHGGTIELLGGTSGVVQVGGTLDASAPHGGNGGQIETSGKTVKVADDAHITTRAVSGENGHWLIDPQDFTIAASGGDITGTALSSDLNAGNVTLQTAFDGNVNCAGASCGTGAAGNGDINVNDAVNWSKNTLTLSAYRNININATMNGTGTAGLALQYGMGSSNGVTASGASADYYVNTPVNLASGASFSTQIGSAGPVETYQVVTNQQQLQGINNTPTQNYVLGNDITTSGDFTPIGNTVSGDTDPYQGTFDGLGHTIANLSISAPGGVEVGLFADTNDAVIRNVNLKNENVTGGDYVGGLIGRSSSTVVQNDSNSGTVVGGGNVGNVSGAVGGLVGISFNNGSVETSSSSATVTATGGIAGGLVGDVSNRVVGGSASGNVTAGGDDVGGLVGMSEFGASITDGHATGNVTSSGNNVGGLAGQAGGAGQAAVVDSSATGSVRGNNAVGGLVGFLTQGQVLNSNSFNPSVNVIFNGDKAIDQIQTIFGNDGVGGLVGVEGGSAAIIFNSYSNQAEMGNNQVGGLVGQNSNGAIEYSHATGFAKALQSSVGGLVGENDGNNGQGSGLIFASYAEGSAGLAAGDGLKSPTYYGPDNAGGLVGLNSGGIINNDYSATAVSNADLYAGGLVGLNIAGGVIENSATSSPVWAPRRSQGGLVAGISDASTTITNVYYLKSGVTEGAGALGFSSSDVPNTIISGSQFADNVDNKGMYTAVTSAAAFKDNGTFQGFDFANVWMPTPDGETVPLLRTPVVLAGSGVYNGSATVNGSSFTISNLGSGPFQVTAHSGVCVTDVCPSTYQPGNDLKIGGSATLIDAGAGVRGFADVSGLTLAGADASEYTLDVPVVGVLQLENDLGQTTQGSFTVTPRVVTVSGGKTYDGTNGIPGADLTVGNLEPTETVTLSGNGILASKDAGTEAVSAFGNLSLNVSPWQHGGDYVLLGQSFGPINVTPAQASITIDATPNTKTYDGTTGAAAIPTVQVNGLLSGDALGSVNESYASKDVLGTGNSTLVPSYTINDGNDGKNYTVAVTSNTAAGTINPLPVTLAGGRAYDAGSTISAADLTVSNLVAGDSVALGGSATLAGKDAGTEPIVGTGSLTLTGMDANNYTTTAASGSAIITPLPLSITGLAVANKTADGTTAATITNLGTLTGVLPGDSVSLGGSARASFASASPGEQVATVAGVTLVGPDARNYDLPASALQTTAQVLASGSSTGTGSTGTGSTGTGSAGTGGAGSVGVGNASTGSGSSDMGASGAATGDTGMGGVSTGESSGSGVIATGAETPIAVGSANTGGATVTSEADTSGANGAAATGVAGTTQQSGYLSPTSGTLVQLNPLVSVQQVQGPSKPAALLTVAGGGVNRGDAPQSTGTCGSGSQPINPFTANQTPGC